MSCLKQFQPVNRGPMRGSLLEKPGYLDFPDTVNLCRFIIICHVESLLLAISERLICKLLLPNFTRDVNWILKFFHFYALNSKLKQYESL
jgi:hypothetical protein